MAVNAHSVAAGAASGAPLAAESAASDQAPTVPTFEQILQELEALVTQLESGDLPLDEALRTFERGVRLTRDCQTALTAAQQKVQQLLQRGDEAVLVEFDRGAAEPGTTGTGGEAAVDS